MDVRIKKMGPEHLGQVLEIEKDSFPGPWPRRLFEQELNSELGQNLVAVVDDGDMEFVIGYASAWTVLDECSINKIACHKNFRNAGTSTRLMKHLVDASYQRGARRFFLEVRKSNVVAQAFYRKLEFVAAGIRKGYYRDTGEDAIIMLLDLSLIRDPGGAQ